MLKLSIKPDNAQKERRRLFPVCGLKQTEYLIPCPTCNKLRWMLRTQWLYRKSDECNACSTKRTGAANRGKPKKTIQGSGSHLFRRGYAISHGYKIISLPIDHPFRSMADKNGKCPEHRLRVAEKMRRLLEPWEIVHHRDGNKQNNCLQNLELLSSVPHLQITSLQKEVRKLQQENAELKREVARLRKSLDNLDSLTDADMQPENLKL